MKAAALTLAAAILLPCGCGPKSHGTPAPEAGPPSWHVVLSDLQPTLLCAWGMSATDVFVVGGPSDG